MQEHLASVGSNTLLVTSGQALMNSMLNGHEQPAVLSAVMKQQMTSRMRQNINDGMDVRELLHPRESFHRVFALLGCGILEGSAQAASGLNRKRSALHLHFCGCGEV